MNRHNIAPNLGSSDDFTFNTFGVMPDNDSTKALYPTPIAFIDRRVRQDWYRSTGNTAMLYSNLDRFLAYAADALKNRRKTSVTCLFTPWMLGITSSGDLYDRIFDQLWSHPRMVRYGSTITIRLVEQTQQGITQTALEIIQFDPWLKNRQHLKPKFAGYQVKMMEFNGLVSRKIEAWSGTLGENGLPIVGRWWGGHRVGGEEDDAVSMAAAFCLKYLGGEDLPTDALQLQGLGFTNANEFLSRR